MALQLVSESEEDEYHSLSPQEQSNMGSTAGDPSLDDIMEEVLPPAHPMASMQGAFEESILESAAGVVDDEDTQDRDAEWRRQELLGHQKYDDSWKSRWRQKSNARYHPLSKLMAQIIFGMHLLLQQQAKSNEEVVRILQTHVNEVDTFLEKTAEDFDLAIADIEERIKHLKLPMTHLDVFKVMLDDKPFRSQLMDGNAKIERIVERTAKAMSAALGDVGEGVRATTDLSRYLENTATRWSASKPEIATVFTAMRGNEQGWMKYLRDLQTRGKTLSKSLALLSSVINEMTKLAAAADARQRYESRPPQRSHASSPEPRLTYETHLRANSHTDKPLPIEPGTTRSREQVSIKQFPTGTVQQYERLRSQPSTPTSFSYKLSKADQSPVRPRTANSERKTSRAGSSTGNPELDEYLSKSGPLRSNPPDRVSSTPRAKSTSGNRPSQAATDFLNAQNVPRPKSQIATLLMSHGDDTSRPNSRGADKAMSTKSAPATRVASTMGNSFARRFSKRMDSGHPTSRDPSRSSATKPALKTMHEAGGLRNVTSSNEIEPDQRPKSRGGSLGFLSRAPTAPLTPSETSASIRHGAEGGQYRDASRATSIRSKATTRTMRSFKLRNFFQRKSSNGSSTLAQ